MTFHITSLGHTAAAEITGLDCSIPMDLETFGAIKDAYLVYPVLVFRDQVLSAAELAAFGRQFGRLERYGNPSASPYALRQKDVRETPDQMLYQSPEDPDVLIMTNETRADLPVIGIVDNAEMWHSDASHQAQPCQAVVVHVIKNPSGGGDTEFCDLRAVYDAIPPSVQDELKGCMGLHHWSKSRNPRFAGALDSAAFEKGEAIARIVPAMSQPVVRTHPESGRHSLYISPRFTLRMDGAVQDGPDVMLNRLFELADDPCFHYRHQWRNNDLTIWDNRCLNHRVRSYSRHEVRCRHRVTIAGDRPF